MDMELETASVKSTMERVSPARDLGRRWWWLGGRRQPCATEQAAEQAAIRQTRRRMWIVAFVVLSIGIILAIVLAVLSQTTDTFGSPASPASRDLCAAPIQRKEWRNLTDTEKLEYIDADLCLMNAPSRLPVEGLQNRWDDLQWVHLMQSNYVHDVGHFLPWHRYYVWLHEHLQRTECNYTGAQPYWEQLLDTGPGGLEASPIWDSETGMGGNGTGPNGCIVDGPFVNLTLHIDSDAVVVDYCITREWNETVFQYANQSYLDACFAAESYDTAWQCFHDAPGPHTAGHSATGGLMALAKAAPGDPVFYLHHANLDRLWWDWQRQHLSARLTDMGGRNTPTAEFLANPAREWEPPGPNLTEYTGDPGDTTTLSHVLWMGGLVPNATVGQVMDIQGTFLCFDYV